MGAVPASTSLGDNDDKQSVTNNTEGASNYPSNDGFVVGKTTPLRILASTPVPPINKKTSAKCCLLNSAVDQPSDAFSPSSPSSNEYFGNSNISEQVNIIPSNCDVAQNHPHHFVWCL